MHRLGALLGKDFGELREMPEPDYRSWELYYLLEPWGWPDREYRTAAIMTAVFNAQGPKRPREISEFIRDMEAEILAYIENEMNQEDEMEKLQRMSLPERRRYFASLLSGNMSVPVVVKDDNGSNDNR